MSLMILNTGYIYCKETGSSMSEYNICLFIGYYLVLFFDYKSICSYFIHVLF